MLTFGAMLDSINLNSSHGLTSKHVFGRGVESLDGTFSEETIKEKPAPQEAVPKVEGP